MTHPCKSLEPLLPYLDDAAWAKRGSFGFTDFDRRAAANAERDPEGLSLLEIQMVLHRRFGPARGSSEDESWGAQQAREFGALLAVVQRRVGRGAFEDWVRSFALFSPRTASRYLRLARKSARPVENVGGVRATIQSAERSFADKPAEQSAEET